jgi:hypothetical protein
MSVFQHREYPFGATVTREEDINWIGSQIMIDVFNNLKDVRFHDSVAHSILVAMVLFLHPFDEFVHDDMQGFADFQVVIASG